MALNITDEMADRLARELASQTGESITTAVTVAVRERLERIPGAVPTMPAPWAAATSRKF